MNGASLFGGLAIRREIRGGLLGYYAVFLIINPLVKAAVTGVAGTIITCFLQMFYITFLFPALMKAAERGKE